MSQVVQAAPASVCSPLLYAGVAAGPLCVGIGTLEAALRDGFDIRVHSLSLLQRPAGWLHSAMMIFTGLLTVLGAVGLRRGSASPSPSGVTVAGIAVFGFGVAAAGFLRADPRRTSPSARRPGHRSWAVFSLITGVYYLVSFAGIASGAGSAMINIAFTVAVAVGWTWLTVLFLARSRRDCEHEVPRRVEDQRQDRRGLRGTRTHRRRLVAAAGRRSR
jgi:hypothetical protein